MPGFDNSVMYADNVDFSGVLPASAKVTLNGQLLIGSTVAPNIRVATLTAGPGIAVTNGAGSIMVAATGVGFSWSTVTSATNVNPILEDNAYITGGALLTTFLLPAAANVGEIFIISGYSSLFQIQQNAGQKIYLGSQTTSVGVAGSLSSTMIKDHVEIVCVIANLEFKVIDSIGNLTIV